MWLGINMNMNMIIWIYEYEQHEQGLIKIIDFIAWKLLYTNLYKLNAKLFVYIKKGIADSKSSFDFNIFSWHH